MTEEEKRALVKYRLERANESMKAAHLFSMISFQRHESFSRRRCANNAKRANNRERADEQSVNAALRSLVGIAKADLRHAN